MDVKVIFMIFLHVSQLGLSRSQPNTPKCSRLAVKIERIRNVDWPFDWRDREAQKSRGSLTLSDYIPNEDDATVLLKQP